MDQGGKRIARLVAAALAGLIPLLAGAGADAASDAKRASEERTERLRIDKRTSEERVARLQADKRASEARVAKLKAAKEASEARMRRIDAKPTAR